MSYIIKTIGSRVSLNITMTKSGSGITGLSPTIEIRRNSDQYYLDFSAVAAPYWVVSGGQSEQVLSEATWLHGFYFWIFDQSVYEDGGSREEYTVIYRNPPPYRTLLTETVSFEIDQETNLNVKRIRQHLENYHELEEISQTHYKHTVFDDAKLNPIHEADITIVGNKEIRNPL